MIATLDELRRAKSLLAEAREELANRSKSHAHASRRHHGGNPFRH